MAEGNMDPDLTLPDDYQVLPLKALRLTSRHKIGQYLNLEGTVVECLDDEGQEIDVSTNYNGLAELAGFDYLDIRNLERHKNPTLELLDCWTNKESGNATVGHLWKYLHKMEREDVLKDCRRAILNDCKVYKKILQNQIDAERYVLEPLQDATISSPDQEMNIDETSIATKDDVEKALANDNDRITYDAFVSYSIEDFEDRQFVRNMIAEIEIEQGLKLFVPGRDDIPGAAQNTINAYLIEKRCRRVVILLSRAFLDSPVCDFQLKFAQCLDQGARKKRLIPVLRESGITTPRLLKYLAACDFTKMDMADWLWERLGAAIKAPIGQKLSSSSADLEENLKEVKFPSLKRRLDHDSDSAPGSRPPGSCDKQPESSSLSGNSVSKESRLETSSGKPMASTKGQSASEPLEHVDRPTTSELKISPPCLINSARKINDPSAAAPQKVSIRSEISSQKVDVMDTSNEQFV